MINQQNIISSGYSLSLYCAEMWAPSAFSCTVANLTARWKGRNQCIWAMVNLTEIFDLNECVLFVLFLSINLHQKNPTEMEPNFILMCVLCTSFSDHLLWAEALSSLTSPSSVFLHILQDLQNHLLTPLTPTWTPTWNTTSDPCTAALPSQWSQLPEASAQLMVSGTNKPNEAHRLKPSLYTIE